MKLSKLFLSLFLGFVVAYGVLGSINSFAKPTDLIPDECKQEFHVNLIGFPGVYGGNCGNGHRIFLDRGANHDHILVVNDGKWHVEWCDATDHGAAELHSDASGYFLATIDVTGKPGGEFEIICADIGGTIAVHEHDGAEECVLEDFKVSKKNGRGRFSLLPNALFDLTKEGVVWSVGTNDDFRRAGIRIWRCPEE